MHLDHVTFAVGPDGLAGTTAKLSAELGAEFIDGGIHPRFGTTNMILPLTNNQYFEVVEVLDHPAADKAAFGQAVRQRSDAGGGWLGWCIAVDDISPIEQRLGRKAVPGNRHRPDGFNLTWLQIGTSGMKSDPQLPYVTQWQTEPSEHPSQAASSNITLQALEIAGSPQRLTDWLGEPAAGALENVEVRWVAPNGTPGILTAEFNTPGGVVRI